MARELKEIKNQLTASFVENPHIQDAYGLTPGKTFSEEFSIASFENVLFDIISYSIYLLELLFKKHREDVDQKLYNQKSGRPAWYRWMALQFQYGFDLIQDTDRFDNTGATSDQITSSKIIKYAAVVASDIRGQIIVKIAGEENGKLAPITDSAKASVESYFDEIKYAGSDVTVINYKPDRLLLHIQIERDPLVLNENGISILNGNNPVNDAIGEFLRELPFNGELVLVSLIDKLQKVPGVKIPHLISASSSWIDPSVNDYGPSTFFSIKRIPESGYFEMLNFDSITYVV